jgi:predicted DNA-binding transcriptional regulator AlpA
MTRLEAAELLDSHDNELLTREEAAGVLRVTAETLRNWEADGKGPPAVNIGPRTTVYSKKGIAAYLEECRAASQAAKAPRRMTAAERKTFEEAVLADRRRCFAITKRAPKGFEAGALKAIHAGASIEEFDASLPGELRALMPPLDRFLADLDKPTDYAGEAAANAILSATRASRH